MAQAQAETASMTLIGVCDGRGKWCGETWRAGLAPEIDTVDLVVDHQTEPASGTAVKILPVCLGLLDDRPYAVCGYGAWALVALELTRLLVAWRPAAHLLVADCSAPHPTALASDGQIGWPITAFAGAGFDGQLTRWRHITTGPFTLRLVPTGEDTAFAGTLQAVKEELRVWPA